MLSVIDAVDEFCADFGQTLGLDRVKAWKETSKLCYNEFKEHRKAWWVVVQHWANGSVPLVPQPSLVLGEVQEALADITVSHEIIEEESQDVPVLIDYIESAPVSASAEESALIASVSVDESAPPARASAPEPVLLDVIPPAVGYQPTLATDMGSMQERIITTKEGSIPSVQAIYVPPNDLADPYPATTLLLRPVAEIGIYPAVDPLYSTSSVMDPNVIGCENYDIIRGVQNNIAILGVDELSEVERAKKFEGFLSQLFQVPEVFASSHGKYVPSSETISGFYEVIAGKFGHKPEVAFHKVGSLTEFENLKQKVEDRMPVAVAHVAMTEDELVQNEYFAVNRTSSSPC